MTVVIFPSYVRCEYRLAEETSFTDFVADPDSSDQDSDIVRTQLG